MSQVTPPSLGFGEVHLHRVTLAGRPDSLAEALLSASERARADRFRNPADGVRWTHARAGLRRILGAYADVSPDRLPLSVTVHGKPYLPAPEGEWLRFNFSHAADVAVLAVARGHAVGVDIELWPRHPGASPKSLHDLAATCLSGPEYEAYRAAPEEAERVRRFLGFWTAKEALLKAEGVGLLDREPAEVRIPPEFGEPGHSLPFLVGAYWLTPLTLPRTDAGGAWAAALAIEGGPPPHVQWVGV